MAKANLKGTQTEKNIVSSYLNESQSYAAIHSMQSRLTRKIIFLSVKFSEKPQTTNCIMQKFF